MTTTAPDGAAALTPYDVLVSAPRLDDQLCFDLVRAARAVTDAYRTPLGRLGLTHTQYLVLLALWQDGTEAVHSDRLAVRLDMDPADLAPAVMRMVCTGLLDVRPDPSAGHWVRATLKADGLRGQLADAHCAVRRQLDLGEAEFRALQAELRRVAATQREDQNEPAGPTT
ncbi:MAG: MarR family transcriptional regulator [Nocardioides sp.]|nr:MarR family transcriptional regulator [Nocardioides sp.]